MVDFEWIRIPAGQARVGSTMEEIDRAVDFWMDKLMTEEYRPEFRKWLLKEYPQHLIETPAFEISDIPVTNALYRRYAEDTGMSLPESLTDAELGGGDNCPVWGVSFEEANGFCKWLSGQLGYEVRIPRESEWERAARGDTDREFPWEGGWNSEWCNSFESGNGHATPVRRYESGRSLFGLYDMAGNVEEWVSNEYDAYSGGEVIEDDLYEVFGTDYKVLKGGSFARGGDLCRVARRHGPFPDPVFRFTGFRVVRA